MVKRRRRSRTLAIVFFACLIVFLFSLTAVLALNDDLTETEYSVLPPDLPTELDGCRIVLISDLHSARFGDRQEELISAVTEKDPDIVVLCGDILDSKAKDYAPIEELLEGISHLPVYAVYGNHENRVSIFDRADLAALYESYGVSLLVDESESISVNGTEICISGMDDPAFWGKGDVDFVKNNPPDVSPSENAFNILLCHRANVYPAVSDLGFELVLSGHLHGGQIRLPLLGGLISPNREIFPDYTSGIYSEGSSVMVVSRGLGNPISIPRIFNAPEIVTVTLRFE